MPIYVEARNISSALGGVIVAFRPAAGQAGEAAAGGAHRPDRGRKGA